MNSDIVISGFSIISPYGEGVRPIIEARLSGLKNIPKINPNLFVSDIPLINNSPYELNNIQKLVAAVSTKALDKACVKVDDDNANKISIFSGNTYDLEDFKMNFFKIYKQAMPELTSPSLFPYTTSNSIFAWLAIQFGIKGANITFSNGCTSASEAILAGSEAITAGTCDIALVIAASVLPEYLIDEFNLCGFRNEIAGAIVLEKKQNVLQSGRTIYALLKDINHSFLLDNNEDVQYEQGADNAVDCIIVNKGNSLADRCYRYNDNISDYDQGIYHIYLSNLVGNTFSAAGILGIALSSEIFNSTDVLKLLKCKTSISRIRFINIDSYGSRVDTIIGANL